MNKTLTSDLEKKLGCLCRWLRERPCVVAFSGGVDSVTLARAMMYVAGQETSALLLRPVAFFAESFSSTVKECLEARQIATEIGIELRVLHSEEFLDQRFVANTPNRCYWCKKIRFEAIKRLANEEFSSLIGQDVVVVDGSNADDRNDYRPGTQAANEVGVKSPLMELGFTKADVRTLATFWGLSVAQKPSNPCLATRVAYNLQLNNSVLRQIEEAEIAIKDVLDTNVCRARVDTPRAVRIELSEECIERTTSTVIRQRLIEAMKRIGFKYISLDLEGFYSGKNNRMLE